MLFYMNFEDDGPLGKIQQWFSNFLLESYTTFGMTIEYVNRCKYGGSASITCLLATLRGDAPISKKKKDL
jgi:hypothetical protein